MSRKLKIEPHDPRGSMLRIKGKWLNPAGFPPGSSVTLQVCSPGVIEIRLNAPAPMTAGFSETLEQLTKAIANQG